MQLVADKGLFKTGGQMKKLIYIFSILSAVAFSSFMANTAQAASGCWYSKIDMSTEDFYHSSCQTEAKATECCMSSWFYFWTSVECHDSYYPVKNVCTEEEPFLL
jgi:hypothetical protein